MSEWIRVCSTDHVTEQCPEVKRLDEDCVAVRSSRFPGDVTNFSQDEWEFFLKRVKAGDLDTV